MTRYVIIAKKDLKQRPTFYLSAADMLRLDMRSGENYSIFYLSPSDIELVQDPCEIHPKITEISLFINA